MGKKLKAGSGLAGGNLGGITQSKQRENRRPQTTSPRHTADNGVNVKENRSVERQTLEKAQKQS